MSILARVRQLLRAEWQEVTATEETPIRRLDQTIKALEEALQQFRQEVTESAAVCRLLEHKLEQATADRKQRRADAETALEAGNETLAREALRRTITLEKVAACYSGQHREAVRLAEQMRTDLAAFEARLEEAKVKRQALISRTRAASLRRDLAEHAARLDGLDAPTSHGLAETFAACDEEVARLDAATDAIREVVAQEPDRAFERLKLDQAVDAELARLKGADSAPPSKQKSTRRRKGA